MNKRGDLQVTIFVFLVLILAVASLFLFYTSNFASVNFDLSNSEKPISDINGFQTGAYFAFQEAAIKTFDEFLKGNEYDYISGRKNTGEFFNLNSRLSENFAKRFKDNLLSIFSAYSLGGNFSGNPYNAIKKGDFDVNFDLDNLTAKLGLVSASNSNDFLTVEYSSPVEIKISLEDIGLEGFDKIYLAKEKCKSLSSSEMKNCFEQELPNFNVEVYSVKDNAKDFGFISTDITSELEIVNLTSKISFSLENKPISFAFVPR